MVVLNLPCPINPLVVQTKIEVQVKKSTVIKTLGTFLSLASAQAYAQSSVTLYGMLDIGVQYLSHTNAQGQKTIGIQSGNEWPSNWGMIGREDLGGGYAAIFRLEAGINLANGANQSPTSFFNRHAYVGIDSPYGAVTVGRQYKVMFDMTASYDPMVVAQYSVLSAEIIPQTTGLSNAIKYKSAVFGGLSGEAEYGFGQQVPGHMAAGTYLGLGLDYKLQSFSARAVYEQSRGSIATPVDSSSQLDKRFSAAAKYNFGPATVYAGYLNVNGDLQLSPNGNMYWGGALYQVTPSIGLTAEVAHYQTRAGIGHPTWYFFQGTYSLSKATVLYAMAGYLQVNGGQHFALNYLDSSSPGNMNQTGVILGIRHQF